MIDRALRGRWIFLVLLMIGRFLLDSARADMDKIDDEHPGRLVRTRRSFPISVLNDYKPADGLIPPGYDKLLGPNHDPSSKFDVCVNMVVMNILAVDEKEEEITMEMMFQMFWKDERLNTSVLVPIIGDKRVNFSPQLLNEIWHPDLYIDQLVSVTQPSITVSPAALFINTDIPLLFYEAKLLVKASCEMDFHYYPKDTIICNLDIKSFDNSDDILNLTWVQWENATQLLPTVNAPGFKIGMLRKQNISEISPAKLNDKFYTTLGSTLYLQRDLSFHLVQSYLPSLIFIIISWMSFLVPNDYAGERIGCSMVSLLSLLVMLDSLGKNIPQVNYLTGLHVWMITCIIFVFIPLMEVVVAVRLWTAHKWAKQQLQKLRKKKPNWKKLTQIGRRKKKEDDERDAENTAVNNAEKLDSVVVENPKFIPPSNSEAEVLDAKKRRLKLLKIAMTLEKYTPIILPICFLIFNVIYWPWLTSEHLNLSHDLCGDSDECVYTTN